MEKFEFILGLSLLLLVVLFITGIATDNINALKGIIVSLSFICILYLYIGLERGAEITRNPPQSFEEFYKHSKKETAKPKPEHPQGDTIFVIRRFKN